MFITWRILYCLKYHIPVHVTVKLHWLDMNETQVLTWVIKDLEFLNNKKKKKLTSKALLAKNKFHVSMVPMFKKVVFWVIRHLLILLRASVVEWYEVCTYESWCLSLPRFKCHCDWSYVRKFNILLVWVDGFLWALHRPRTDNLEISGIKI